MPVKCMGKYEENLLNLQQWTDSLYERCFFPGNKSCSYRIPLFFFIFYLFFFKFSVQLQLLNGVTDYAVCISQQWS